MSKKILIDATYQNETRVVIYHKNRIQDFDYENCGKKQIKGNIYLARVTRVEPSLQAAFIEYGSDKHGFLPFNEIHPNYFNINQTAEQNETATAREYLNERLSAINLPEITDSEEDGSGNINIISTDHVESLEENIEEQSVSFVSDGEGAEFLHQIEGENSCNDDSEEPEQPRNQATHQKHRIQDVIKKGQMILIQIMKEERGNKGASCTSYISLAGRYCVLMPNSDKQGGISRRIVNQNDRKRMKDVLSLLDLQDGVSIILRTAGAGKNLSDIRRDYYYLARLWNAIREHVLTAAIPSFIHAESDLLKRTIRDLYSSEISEIQIQGNEAFKYAKDFVKKILPAHLSKVKEYRSKTPIFTKYAIEDQIAALYSPISNLPSGGYIVINSTEALIAIDVNSGKATNEINIEETATKTNIEAAVEVARQLRLRDLSGLIVIDFIDMMELGNRRAVERTLREAFQADRAKVQLGPISSFGLLELSRQRLKSSFMETNTILCPACTGKGHIRSYDSNALMILRTIESEIYKNDCNQINIYAHPDIVLYLLNNKRSQISALEEQYKCKIVLNKENATYYDGFALEKTSKNDRSCTKLQDSPSFNDEEYIDSYGQEDIEEESVIVDTTQALTPYNVNDEKKMKDYMRDNAANDDRSNRNKFRKDFHSRKRKISNAAVTTTTTTATAKVEASPLTEQPSVMTKRPHGKQRKPSKFYHDRNRTGNENKDTNKAVKKKSAILSWWEKLTQEVF